MSALWLTIAIGCYGLLVYQLGRKRGWLDCAKARRDLVGRGETKL